MARDFDLHDLFVVTHTCLHTAMPRPLLQHERFRSAVPLLVPCPTEAMPTLGPSLLPVMLYPTPCQQVCLPCWLPALPLSLLVILSPPSWCACHHEKAGLMPSVCAKLQLWTAQPPLAEWIRRGQPVHTPPLRPPSTRCSSSNQGSRRSRRLFSFVASASCL
eukprot:366377-Chlamydomonas_euryale.AAC.8